MPTENEIKQRIAELLETDDHWKVTVLGKKLLCPFDGTIMATISNDKDELIDKIYQHLTNECENWKEFEFEEKKEKIAAIDGSYNFKQYHSFVLYAISSVSIFLDKRILKSKFIDLDIEKPAFFIEEKLKLRMTLAELEMLYKELLNKNCIGIIDGSLIAELIRPFYSSEIGELKKVEIIENTKKLFAEKIGSKILISKNEGIDESGFAEYIEYFFTLYLLFKTFSKQIIAISKSSTSNQIFETQFSDLFLFENFTKREGYSKPFYFSIAENIKKGFPIFNEFFKSLEFTIFYLRLKENSPILKVEIPYRIDENEIINICSILKRISVNGYPYLLRKAHKEALIRNWHLERIEKVLGIIERTGREVLKF